MSEICKPYDEKMKKTIEVVKGDFGSVRAGRANAAVLDRIQVSYYGTPTPIHQVASISTPDPRTLAIQPWDMSILRDIERAIQTSELGINPQNDANGIYCFKIDGFTSAYLSSNSLGCIYLLCAAFCMSKNRWNLSKEF